MRNTLAFLITGLAKLQSAQNATELSQAEMDQMIQGSCQGDLECLQFLDELAALELGGLTRTLSAENIERLNYLRRLKNLKMLVLHLQPEHRFLRYCHYGCYCLTDPLYKKLVNVPKSVLILMFRSFVENFCIV